VPGVANGGGTQLPEGWHVEVCPKDTGGIAMKALALAVVAAFSFGATEAMAHHKPGHNPPGHSKHKQTIVILEPELTLNQPRYEIDDEVEIVGALPPRDDEPDWMIYQDAEFGFTLELPLHLFQEVENTEKGIQLREASGDGLLEVYGVENAEYLSPDEIATVLEDDPQITEVTYQASGANWIVLSGYYERESYESGELIFYAKFMFNANRSRISAFEISYPERDRDRYDSIVERLEESLSRPAL
jgi:hypothetical protein